MDPERWKEIERLCQNALEMEPSRREEYLKGACAGDESLRKEVEALLANLTEAEDFMKDPAIDVAAKALAKEQENALARDLIGRTIAHYRIVEKIGQGGMGEVFLAEDTSLHRRVALKFLPPEMQQNPAAHKRFLREAHSAAALDHPFICGIHEVSEFEGKRVHALAARLGRPVKILIGKPGLDGHSNGAEQIAGRARDAGMEVVYEGIRLTPAEIVQSARDEGVHAIGLSILSGSHGVLVHDVLEGLRSAGVAVPVVVGGIIPEDDAEALLRAGVKRVYTPKDFDLTRLMDELVDVIEEAHPAR